MYLYETHMHTSEVSRCGRASAREMVMGLKERGYAGGIITDHFLWGNTYAVRTLPWEERVRILMNGYNEAKAAGDELGIQIFLGWEATSPTIHDLLTYGLDEQFLLANPDLHDIPVEEYLKRCTEAGGLVVQAHPYRKAHYIPKPGPEDPSLLGGIEVRNAGNVQSNQPEANDLALAFAEAQGLPQTSGSDAHHPLELVYGMAFLHKLTDINDFIAHVKAGDSMLV